MEGSGVTSGVLEQLEAMVDHDRVVRLTSSTSIFRHYPSILLIVRLLRATENNLTHAHIDTSTHR